MKGSFDTVKPTDHTDHVNRTSVLREGYRNLADLIEGNRRFISKVDGRLLKDLSAKGQKPEAVVVSCSDSRVPVEVILDETLPGKLFVVRVAGNVVSGPVVIGSIEYAVSQLNVSTIVLLGHTGCGAVRASIEGKFESETLAQLCGEIRCRSKELARAVVENLEYQFQNLLEIDCIKKGVKNGMLKAYAVIYDLPTGRISIIRGAPDQS